MLLWMALGAAIALAAMYACGRRLHAKGYRRAIVENPYGLLLGRKCKVLKGDGTWRECEVVAVGHKGSLCVRNLTSSHGKWISKEKVPERVRFEEGGRV